MADPTEKEKQYKRELGNINRQSNTVADDLKLILDRLDKADSADRRGAVRRDLEIVQGKLKGFAHSYEPDPEAPDPNDPNITGASREDGKTEKDRAEEQKLKNQEQNPNPNPDELPKGSELPQAPNINTETGAPKDSEPQGQPGAPNLAASEKSAQTNEPVKPWETSNLLKQERDDPFHKPENK